MRVVFLGNAPWSVPSVEALAASRHDVLRVVTRVPRPAGRGSKLTPTAVAEAAVRLGVPLVEVETVKSGPGREALTASPFDVLGVVAYGEILPEAVLGVPAVAPVNVHFSLLPELRGGAPVHRAIMEGLSVTGVTTMRMDAGMDTGPILAQEEEEIRPDDDAGSLGRRLAALGGRLLVQTLDGLEGGTVRERRQDDSRATYAPKLRPEERIIDWRMEAGAIVRLVRALSPEPGATTTFRGRSLKVLRVSEEGPSSGGGEVAAGGAGGGLGTVPAGSVAAASREGLVVATGKGLVRLDEVAPEARRRMSGGEFVRGYRPGPGESLG